VAKALDLSAAGLAATDVVARVAAATTDIGSDSQEGALLAGLRRWVQAPRFINVARVPSLAHRLQCLSQQQQ